MAWGLERNLERRWVCAAVMKKSTAKFGERSENPKAMVGEPADKNVVKGGPLVTPFPLVAPPLTQVNGDGGTPPVMPLQPTDASPPKRVRPPVMVPAKPSSVPMSCAKERDAETTRASISTCCDLRSRLRIRLSMFGMTEGMSRMISWFERSSNKISPRELRNFFSVLAVGAALA